VRIAWIALAGGAGAVSRYLVEGWVSTAGKGDFPYGTLVVNVSGSFLLGFLFTLLTERLLPHPDLRIALTIGFIGAYTTFSTLTFETLQLGQAGAMSLAVLNIVASVIAGMVAVWLGTVAGRAL
jgi:fluoride exporter